MKRILAAAWTVSALIVLGTVFGMSRAEAPPETTTSIEARGVDQGPTTCPYLESLGSEDSTVCPYVLSPEPRNVVCPYLRETENSGNCPYQNNGAAQPRKTSHPGTLRSV